MGLETVGAILSMAAAVYGGVTSYQTGKSANAIAKFNAYQQERAAEMQLMAMQAQSRMQAQTAEANFRLAASEAEARMKNARVMETNVAIQDKVDRANLRARREEFERRAAEQRSQIAVSGVRETGTPLDLMVETVALIQRDQEEQAWGAENERRTILNQASLERFGGKLAMAGALAGRSVALGESRLTAAKGRADFLSGKREAEITRLTGRAAYGRGISEGIGTILTGTSGALGKLN